MSKHEELPKGLRALAGWLNEEWPRHYRDIASAAADALEAQAREIEGLRKDAERLDWLLWKLPGDALRHVVGALDDTADAAEFRAAIDAAKGAPHG